MKLISSLFIVALFFVLTASRCKKDLVTNPIDQLPPETQTGANTFGCLVNGQVFLPGGNSTGGGNTQCNYQFFNGGYYVVIAGTNNGNSVQSVAVVADSFQLGAGKNYVLKEWIKGQIAGRYYFGVPAGASNLYFTNSNASSGGEVNITKLDTVNQIMSGTFWFNAISSNGDLVKVTDGRFDMHYTR